MEYAYGVLYQTDEISVVEAFYTVAVCLGTDYTHFGWLVLAFGIVVDGFCGPGLFVGLGHSECQIVHHQETQFLLSSVEFHNFALQLWLGLANGIIVVAFFGKIVFFSV